MMRIVASLWLILILAAGSYVSERVLSGLHFQTDLMALLPQEQQDSALKHINDISTHALSQRVVFLVGDKDRVTARTAATNIAHDLSASGAFILTTNNLDKNQLRQMGAFYYPYRAGLLSDEDRATLKANQGQGLATRALSQIYGMAGFANAKLLHGDPFLLLPSFLTSLPLPLSRLSLDDGLLSVQDKGLTWILISGQVKGEPFALDTQKQAAAAFDAATQSQRHFYPDLETLHLGAVFFAKAGAEQAMSETSTIGILSTLGTILLIIFMFRAIRPLLLSLLVIGTGFIAALAASLLIFGELHVGALLFGTSLIGVSVDYSLQYCSEVFSPNPGTPQQRLQRVLMGITLGTATTVIGYLTLCLAPFPGLHQIAVFSAVGLLASWLTVVLWLPRLDRETMSLDGHAWLTKTKLFLAFWEQDKYRKGRIGLIVILILSGIAGFTRFHSDDNVRRMQSLSAPLVAEQEKIQSLIGTTAGSQFIIVQAPTDEDALQCEEQLAEKLHPLVASGALAGFQSVAQYIPSQQRQTENRNLQREQLYEPLLAQQTQQLGLKDNPEMQNDQTPFLTLDNPPAFLSSLLLDNTNGEVTHMVALDAVTQPAAINAAIQGMQGVRFIDPAGDFSNLLGKYRARAIRLLALSALLMAPLLIWRYDLRKGLWIMVPPLLATFLAPALRALTGDAFTFFDAMALVLVLSIGVDYAVFCAETSETRKPVTFLAVTMAACTALLSFGLLAFSGVSAVHHFGATMTIGSLLSFLFAPMARLDIKTPVLIRNLLPLILVFILCSCATPPQDKPTGIVQIAPDVTLTLPHPADLGRPVEATQLVTAQYGDQTFAFEAHISATPDHFRLAGLDMMGRKLLTIDWTQDNINYQTAPFVPSDLRPENILADIVLLYWPTAIVQKSLSGGILIAKTSSRIISQSNQKIWQATYQSKPKSNPWSGQLDYRNLAWGYHFTVQSVEQAP